MTARTAAFPNAGHAPSTTIGQTPPSTAAPVMSPELEDTLNMVSAHRSVLGYILLSRGQPVRIIRHAGGVFEGDSGRRYARAIGRMLEGVQAGLEDIYDETSDTDEVRFMRIRTRRHEILISPDERYLLAVLHDPESV